MLVPGDGGLAGRPKGKCIFSQQVYLYPVWDCYNVEELLVEPQIFDNKKLVRGLVRAQYGRGAGGGKVNAGFYLFRGCTRLTTHSHRHNTQPSRLAWEAVSC